jgi:hypothetical protein
LYIKLHGQAQVAKIRIAARTSFSIVKIKKLNLKTNTILLLVILAQNRYKNNERQNSLKEIAKLFFKTWNLEVPSP